jgi:sugar lactone lactonase YvrE
MLFAERITDPVTDHGEGPFWDELHGRLLCVDALAGAVVAIGDSGETERHQLPTSVVTVVRRRSSGGFVLATAHGVAVVNSDFLDFKVIAQVTGDPKLRANDGGCDPFGNFVVGTMAYDERAEGGAVYLVTSDHMVVELLSPVSISNGVQWSADGSRVYYVDSPTRRVDIFDVDPATGLWANRRQHIHVQNKGIPDGMAIDEEDGLWVALWGSGAVYHYDASGRLVEQVRIAGITQVSSCAFGGPGNDVLYITTSRLGLHPGSEPDAGAVFAVQTGSRGAVQSEFAG